MATASRMVVKPQGWLAGAVGGLAGGLAFGAMMAMQGMLPMVAMLVNSESALLGFVLHLLISVAIGVSFGVVFGSRLTTPAQGAGWGLAYGLVWWVLGPLVLMPLMLGMGLQFGAAFTEPMLMSLLGHAVFGVVTGLVAAWFARR